ncbi:hypothetical protein YC2023_124248 [Brassica napus]
MIKPSQPYLLQSFTIFRKRKRKGEIIDLFQLLASVSSMTRANTDCDSLQMDRLEPLSTYH